MYNMESQFKERLQTPSIPTIGLEFTHESLRPNSSNEKLMAAVYTNYNKYGYNQAVVALKSVVETGNVMKFTRDYNAREIIQSMSVQEIKNIIVSECGSLNYDLFMNEMLRKKALEIKCQSLENACIGTLKKYGETQVRLALNEAKKGNFSGFSNCGDLNLRETLIRTVKAEEIAVLMHASLIRKGIDNENDFTSDFLNTLVGYENVRQR